MALLNKWILDSKVAVKKGVRMALGAWAVCAKKCRDQKEALILEQESL